MRLRKFNKSLRLISIKMEIKEAGLISTTANNRERTTVVSIAAGIFQITANRSTVSG